MGKVTKLTGSRALGAELRRLRGRRTLADISRLSASEAFQGRIKSISAPTLCQVESGQTMPTLDSLHALATVYRVSPQRLYDLIAQGRLVESTAVPSTLEEVHDQFTERSRLGEWDQALALCLRAEEIVNEESERLPWRANRAACLGKLGMRQEAIWLMQELLEDPAFPAQRRFRLLSNLSLAHAEAGLHGRAAELASQAAAEAPEDLDASVQVHLLRAAATLLVLAVEARVKDERSAREAKLLLDRAATLIDAADARSALAVRLEIAVATRWSGNHVLAARELEEVGKAARSEGWTQLEMLAWYGLGALNRQRSRWTTADRFLERADLLARDLADTDNLFEILVERCLVAEGQSADSTKLKRLVQRCEKVFPLVVGRTPAVTAFERLRSLS